MKKNKIYIIIAFALFPLIATLFYSFDAPTLNYGNKELTINSLFYLLYGLFCVFACTMNFIDIFKTWKKAKKWKNDLLLSYGYAISLAILLAAMYFFDYRRIFPIDFENVILSLIFFSLTMLFPIGILLIVLSIIAFRTKRKKIHKWFITTTLSTGILFFILGVFPTVIVIIFWLNNGIGI